MLSVLKFPAHDSRTSSSISCNGLSFLFRESASSIKVQQRKISLNTLRTSHLLPARFLFEQRSYLSQKISSDCSSKRQFSKNKNSRNSAQESFSKRRERGNALIQQTIQSVKKNNSFKKSKKNKIPRCNFHSSCQKLRDGCHGSQENNLAPFPTSSLIIHNSEYSIGYDLLRRTPAWVLQHLTAESIKGQVKRSLFDFKEDERIPPHVRVTPTDYRRSGFDRGHMAPTADYRSSHKAMHETFYMTNICPQWPKFNSGYWAKVEKHVRDLTNHYPHVYVTTGPLFLPFVKKKKRYVKYQVIGKNQVAVPTHFFKYIRLEDEKGKKEIRAYILPNKEIPLDTPLEQFRTTAQRIEKAAGLILSP